MARLGDRNSQQLACAMRLSTLRIFQFDNEGMWSEQTDGSMNVVNVSIEDILNRTSIYKDGAQYCSIIVGNS